MSTLTTLKMECPSCAMEVDEGQDECPICGYEFPVQRKSVTSAAVLMAGILIIPVLWLLYRLFA